MVKILSGSMICRLKSTNEDDSKTCSVVVITLICGQLSDVMHTIIFATE